MSTQGRRKRVKTCKKNCLVININDAEKNIFQKKR